MSGEIIKVLDELGKRFGVAIDWTSDNVIPYLERLGGRYVNWVLAMNLIGLTLSLAVIIGWSVFLHKNKDFGVTHYITIRDDNMVRIMTSIPIYMIGSFVFLITLFGTTECLVFPEKVIIDKLISIYQGMQ